MSGVWQSLQVAPWSERQELKRFNAADEAAVVRRRAICRLSMVGSWVVRPMSLPAVAKHTTRVEWFGSNERLKSIVIMEVSTVASGNIVHANNETWREERMKRE